VRRPSAEFVTQVN